MFEKTSMLAERVATSVSRRGFFGSLGRWATTAALGIAGLLVSPREARASTRTCCVYGPGRPLWFQCVAGGEENCPATYNGYPLIRNFHDKDCNNCYAT